MLYSYANNRCISCCYILYSKNIGGEKLWWRIWQITAFHQVFLPMFTISITFPMQMDFNSSKFLPTVLIRQGFLPPKFFAVRYLANNRSIACYKQLYNLCYKISYI